MNNLCTIQFMCIFLSIEKTITNEIWRKFNSPRLLWVSYTFHGKWTRLTKQAKNVPLHISSSDRKTFRSGEFFAGSCHLHARDDLYRFPDISEALTWWWVRRALARDLHGRTNSLEDAQRLVDAQTQACLCWEKDAWRNCASLGRPLMYPLFPLRASNRATFTLRARETRERHSTTVKYRRNSRKKSQSEATSVI